jgi:hypothetical protein
MRPIRFSALKAFDPLHKEVKRGENHDRQPDIGEVLHGTLQGFLLVCAPWPATRSAEADGGRPVQAPFRWRSGPCAVADGFSEASGKGGESGPNGTHAGPMRFLTEPMRRARSPSPGADQTVYPRVSRPCLRAQPSAPAKIAIAMGRVASPEIPSETTAGHQDAPASAAR